MHIKHIAIEGFKSYASQPALDEEFSPGHNVIVGRNGSGKSNFFNAIRFVLGDKYGTLSKEARSALLHEGKGRAVLNAVVEITFDNSDRRFPVETDEVTLRRAIGSKKDEYFLNKKHITKDEVRKLLEAAGFSKSNPYYIVEQGKVAALTVMSDEKRLDLLKEIAGTKLHEDRKKESEKTIKNTIEKIQKVNEIVANMNEKLQELDAEKDELEKYNKLDKEKRALTFSLLEKELEKVNSGLKKIEQEYSSAKEGFESSHGDLSTIESRLKDLERERKKNNQLLENLKTEHEQISKKVKGTLKRKTDLKLTLDDLKDRANKDRSKEAEYRVELEKVNEEIQKLENVLGETIIPEYEELKKKHVDATVEQKTLSGQLDSLREKRGRAEQFATKQERDFFLKKKIDSMKDQSIKVKHQLDQSEQRKDKLEGIIEEKRQQAANVEARIKEQKTKRKELEDIIHQKELEQEQSLELRKNAWNRQAELRSVAKTQRRNYEDNLHHFERTRAAGMNKAINHINKFVKSRPDLQDKVFGSLIDVFNIPDESVWTAVEVTAGTALFYTVVDNDATAALLIQELERAKVGRLSFLPLDNLHPQEARFPEGPGDFAPLMEYVQPKDDRFMPAVRQIFGKTLLCNSIDLAMSMSTRFGVNCVTVDGDECSKKGSVMGGYSDNKRSRLDAHTRVTEAKNELDTTNAELDALEPELKELNKNCGTAGNELEIAKDNLNRFDRANKEIFNEMQSQRENLKKMGELSAKEHNRVEELLLTVQSHERQIEEWEAEITSEMSANLTPEEEQKFRDMNARKNELDKEILDIQVPLDAAKRRLDAATHKFEEAFPQRRDELNQLLAGFALDGEDDDEMIKQSLASAILNHRRAKRAHEEAEGKLESIEARVREAEKQLVESDAAAEKDRQAVHKKQSGVSNDQKKIEVLENRRTDLQKKRDDRHTEIRQLGTVSQKVLEAFKDLRIKQLRESLNTTNTGLKQLSHVNKKAYDQYKGFTEQREELTSKLSDLQKGCDYIKRCLDKQDRDKDEKIMISFKKVQEEFKKVFAELVPNGRGELILNRSSSQANEEGEEESKHEDEDRNVDEFGSVSVKVAFTEHAETQRMQELSGGQKAIVALAFIFAMQRSDPAPFYLFDEIDQALDPVYRSAVADLVERQADGGGAQFITSTFKSELVEKADMCFGIVQANKESSVAVMDPNEALDFINRLMQEDSSQATRGSRASHRSGPSAGGSVNTSRTGATSRSTRSGASRMSRVSVRTAQTNRSNRTNRTETSSASDDEN